MEIIDIQAIPLADPLEDGRAYGSSRNLVTARTATLVRLELADGTVGWGNAFGPPKTTATMIEEVFAELVLGMSPDAVGTLADRSSTLFYHLGSSGVLQCALSGVEIAMFDALGKSIGKPVSALLGGSSRQRVTPYASTLYIAEWDESPQAPIQRAVDDGFTAAKIKIGTGLEDDLERIAAAREVLGEDGSLMIDVNGNYRPYQAIELVHAVEPYDITWLEEPLPPEDLDGYREVKRVSNVPIAAGEAAYSRFGFQRLLDNRAVDILQPDVTKCGGILEATLVGKLATNANVSVSPHCWASAVGLAAALQVAAVLPDYPHSTNRPEPLWFEVDRAPNGLRSNLLAEPIDLAGGSIAIPDGPGLGVTVDEDVVERYRIN